MTKKELAKINKELVRTEQFLNSLTFYDTQLGAIRRLLEVSIMLAKRALPYEIFKEHRETLEAACRDLQGLVYEVRSYQGDLEEKRALLEEKKNALQNN